MSMHVKKPSIDNIPDKSDILSILESIESMFEVCQNLLNSYSQTAILLSITTEAEMLLLKLGKMEKRWNVHLPFKEASTVDFYAWSKKIEQMALAIGGAEVEGDSENSIDEYCPSKHYLLDLYECLDESSSQNGASPYYTNPDVGYFIAEQNRIRKQIVRKWKLYHDMFCQLVPRELDKHIGEVLKPLADRSVNIRMTCHTVLRELSTSLYNLYDTPRGNISRDQFARLAERVLEEEEYGGRKVKTTVEHEIKEAKYNTPEDQWDSTREEEIKASYDLIKDMKLGNKVFSFIGRDKTIFDNPAGFGRFLWSVRHNIGNRELYNLIELLSRIAYLSKDREQQAEIIEETTPAQPAQFESKDADTVYRKRSAAKLQKPRLPNFFNEELAINENAVKSYYDTLHRCGFYIGRTLLSHEKRDPDIRYYAGWKWKHLREAFVKLGFIKKDSSKKGFAEYLADVFPYLEATNIQRGFNSRGGYTDPNATRRIINDMVSEFEEVSDLITGG